MPLVLINDRPRQFQFVATGGTVDDHVLAPDPHPAYASDQDLIDHGNASDPHPGYMTPAETNTRFDAHEALADPHPGYMTTGEDAAVMAAHAADTDPHPGYLTVVEGDAAIAVHAGLADPHPGYLTPAEGGATYAPLVHSHPPQMKGPYRGGSFVNLASGAPGRVSGSLIVPDPGFDWYPLAFGRMEARAALNTRPACAVIYKPNGTTVARGAGLDPINQGSGGNGYWMINAVPYFSATIGAAQLIPAGAADADRTFELRLERDYGSGNVESTSFFGSIVIWVTPA